MTAAARTQRTEGPPTAAPSLTRVAQHYLGRFAAMASPCELLVDTDDAAEAAALLQIVAKEASRIEAAFSRYRTGNIVHRINNAGGQTIVMDAECAELIDYAVTCLEISGGKFDITSGVLRRLWTFDGGNHSADPAAVSALLERVGWHRVTWRRPELTMPAGMEIDLGGIGKEYAVDRAAALIAAATERAFLVNFGGDLFASGVCRDGNPWTVGVEDPGRTGEAATYKLEVERGGLATSGDARRFLMVEGKRLGHILNPITGWPVEGAPRSVTVLAHTCMEAGTLATLATLEGPRARAFLEEQGVRFWLA